MEKRYCRNDKGLCSQIFMRPIGFDGYVLLCGCFSDPNVKGRLHLLNKTRHGIVRLKECRAKFEEHKQTATNNARKEILLCSYTGFCLANQHGICTDACFCNCQRKTSSVA